MEIKDIYGTLDSSIAKLSDLPLEDQQELEKVIEFGVSAIGTLEGLVDTVMSPLVRAKKELFKSRDADKVQEVLVEIATDIYDELDEAQDMVFRFSALNNSFNVEIAPILAKHFGPEKIHQWRTLFDLTKNTRAVSYARVESLVPKIEELLELRSVSPDAINAELNLKELKDYLNEMIAGMRSTKKELRSVKSNFLRISGLKGLTNITQKQLPEENKTEAVSNVIADIEDLVANGRTETALNKMADLCNYNYPEILKDIIMLQSRFSAASKDLSFNGRSDNITVNQVSLGLLRLVGEIKKREDLD